MQYLALLMNNLKNSNCFEKAEAGGKKIKIMGLTDKLSNEVQTKPIWLLTLKRLAKKRTWKHKLSTLHKYQQEA